jgi:YbbR domain-containing protein
MREWLSSNTGLKIVALILATIMWFYVNSITSEHRVIESVRVETLTPPHLVVQRISEPLVSVVLRGAHADLSQITRADLTALVDLRAETTPGKVVYQLSPDSIRHPNRVQVSQVMPMQISFWLAAVAATNSP